MKCKTTEHNNSMQCHDTFINRTSTSNEIDREWHVNIAANNNHVVRVMNAQLAANESIKWLDSE